MSIEWRKLALDAILVDGKIDAGEVALLKKALKGEGGGFSDEGLEFIFELRAAYLKKAKAKKEEVTEEFDKFFSKLILDHVVKEGKLAEGGVSFLKEKVFPDAKKVDDKHFELLTTIGKKAKEKHGSFEELVKGIEAARAKAKKD